MLDTILTASPLRGLAEELQRQLQTKRDLMADTRRVSLAPVGGGETVPNGVMVNVDLPEGATGFWVTKHAHGQIADHIGVPLKLYERLLGKHPDLLAGLANGLLAREHSKRLLRTMDGKVRAFLSDKYRPRDNWDLLEGAVLPALEAVPARVEFKECTLSETRMYIKVFLPDLERPVTPRPGDVIRGGLVIANSEVGSSALLVAPYTDRLICSNGMVHTEFGQRRLHVGRRNTGAEGVEAWDLYSDATLKLDDAAFFAKCRDTITAALNETIFDRIVGQMRDLADTPVEGAPDAVVEVFAAKHGLTDGERGSMLSALIDEGDRSAWGYLNGLTRTARDHADPDRRFELEALAGRLCSDPDWALATA